MKTVNYPIRSGAFEGALLSLKFDLEISKLLGYSSEKMAEFQKLIDKRVSETEERIQHYTAH